VTVSWHGPMTTRISQRFLDHICTKCFNTNENQYSIVTLQLCQSINQSSLFQTETSIEHRIFNHLPYFVQMFRISIYLATTGKNFMQIAYHLSEIWKKTKRGPFIWNTVYNNRGLNLSNTILVTEILCYWNSTVNISISPGLGIPSAIWWRRVFKVLHRHFHCVKILQLILNCPI